MIGTAVFVFVVAAVCVLVAAWLALLDIYHAWKNDDFPTGTEDHDV